MASSVNRFWHSEFQGMTAMTKDTMYRLKNHEKVPWRPILYGIATRFQNLVNRDQIVAPHAAVILDDTTDRQGGRHLENVSYVVDHVIGKTLLGFKHLVLGFFDGTTFIPLDFSIHTEQRLRGRKRQEQYRKICRPGSPGFIRRQECAVDKIPQAIAMVKRASSTGFRLTMYWPIVGSGARDSCRRSGRTNMARSMSSVGYAKTSDSTDITETR
jgi:hypothetical protein